MLNIKGKVKELQQPVFVGAKQLKKQTIVVQEEGDKYPMSAAIDFMGEKTDQLDPLNEGDVVDATFSIVSKEYNGRTFNNLQGMSVKLISSAQQSTVDNLPF